MQPTVVTARRTKQNLIRMASLLTAAFPLASGAAPPGLEPTGDRPVLVRSPESGWPQWRGPRRDGHSDEKGLLQSWPEGGPKLLWTRAGLGQGYSAPVITQGRIFITGEAENELRIHALDLQGRGVWQSRNGQAWDGPYPGARASCTYSEGRLYNMNGRGRVACFDAGTGRELWGFDMFERFGGRNLTWATAENLLVDGSRVLVTPGGTRALMAALDKKTGATLWTCEPLRLGQTGRPEMQRLPGSPSETDQCSYGSPILVDFGGRRMVVTSSLRHVFGVDAGNGHLLWTRPWPTRYSVIAATPVLVGDAIFVTSPDTDDGGRLFRIRWAPSAVRADTVWTTPLDTCHGGQVCLDNVLYGSWYRRGKGWACVDATTGKVHGQLNDVAQGSVLYADRRLYCLSQEGEMTLIKPALDRLEVTGRFRLVSGRKSDVWTHPVILDGRLYLRYQDQLSCYDVRAE